MPCVSSSGMSRTWLFRKPTTSARVLPSWRIDSMRQTSPTATRGPSDSMTSPMTCRTRPRFSHKRVWRTRARNCSRRLAEVEGMGVERLMRREGLPTSEGRNAFSWQQGLLQQLQLGLATSVNDAESGLDDATGAGDLGGALKVNSFLAALGEEQR